MKAFLRSVAIIGLCLTGMMAHADATTTAVKEKSLGVFGAWHAYSYNEAGQTVCYMVTTKILQSSGLKKRSIPYLMITHRPIEASTDVVSYGAGAMVNARHGIKMTVGKNAFDMFSVRDTSWTRDAQTDHKLAAALRNASMATATGFLEKKGGKAIKDQFDLTGAAAAYHAIGRACGLPGEAPKKTVTKKKTVSKKTTQKK